MKSPVQPRVSQQVQRLALLARKKQQRATNHDRPHTSPYWGVDRLLVLYRQLDRAQLDLMSLLAIVVILL